MSARWYRKKPVEVEAVRWDGTHQGALPIVAWILNGGGAATYDECIAHLHSPSCRCDGRGIVPGPTSAVACPETEPSGGRPAVIAIATLEGTMRADAGDWIIRGIRGEYYPCKPDIFTATYEPLDGDEAGRVLQSDTPDDTVQVPRAVLMDLHAAAKDIEDELPALVRMGDHLARRVGGSAIFPSAEAAIRSADFLATTLKALYGSERGDHG